MLHFSVCPASSPRILHFRSAPLSVCVFGPFGRQVADVRMPSPGLDLGLPGRARVQAIDSSGPFPTRPRSSTRRCSRPLQGLREAGLNRLGPKSGVADGLCPGYGRPAAFGPGCFLWSASAYEDVPAIFGRQATRTSRLHLQPPCSWGATGTTPRRRPLADSRPVDGETGRAESRGGPLSAAFAGFEGSTSATDSRNSVPLLVVMHGTGAWERGKRCPRRLPVSGRPVAAHSVACRPSSVWNPTATVGRLVGCRLQTVSGRLQPRQIPTPARSIC